MRQQTIKTTTLCGLSCTLWLLNACQNIQMAENPIPVSADNTPIIVKQEKPPQHSNDVMLVEAD